MTCDRCGRPIYEVGWCQIHGMTVDDACPECGLQRARALERAREIQYAVRAERQRVHDALQKAFEFRRLVGVLLGPLIHDGDDELTTLRFLIEEVEQARHSQSERRA